MFQRWRRSCFWCLSSPVAGCRCGATWLPRPQATGLPWLFGQQVSLKTQLVKQVHRQFAAHAALGEHRIQGRVIQAVSLLAQLRQGQVQAAWLVGHAIFHGQANIQQQAAFVAVGGELLQLFGVDTRNQGGSYQLDKQLAREPCHLCAFSKRLARALLRDRIRVLEQRVERSVLAEQLRRALLADSLHARNVVGAVSDQRAKVEHLRRRHSETRLDRLTDRFFEEIMRIYGTPEKGKVKLPAALSRDPFFALSDKFDRTASIAPRPGFGNVEDLAASATAEPGKVSLSWTYANAGDYNQDGEVGVSDITPIAISFGAITTDGTNDPAERVIRR